MGPWPIFERKNCCMLLSLVILYAVYMQMNCLNSAQVIFTAKQELGQKIDFTTEPLLDQYKFSTVAHRRQEKSFGFICQSAKTTIFDN